MRFGPILPVLAAAALAAGCASASAPKPSAATLFASSCGACHTLTGVNSPRKQGGDLLHVHLSHADLVQFTREMPVRHPLSASEVDAVTAYVLAAERRG
jgi:mono/diheme cytochrome c family protein